MTTATKIMTADELLAMPDDGFHRYELVKGELITMPPAGYEHGVIGFDFGSEIRQFVKANDLGRVSNSDTGFIISTDPDTVRMPDVAFVRKERIPSNGLPKGFFPGAPDLAVEVISPSDSYTEVAEKVVQLLEAGTLLVVLIDPRTRTITLRHRSGETTTLTESDTLTLGDVLPGFECPVGELFV
ncbi:MAG: Uma2 family endonuclease [Chloroflexota bacterium]|nr:Uma2 family endonuclease [Chloroflexota bacterium]